MNFTDPLVSALVAGFVPFLVAVSLVDLAIAFLVRGGRDV